MDPVIKSHKATNENTGNKQGVQHLVQHLGLPDAQDTAFSYEKTTCLTVAFDSVQNSRRAVEKLLDSISRDDHYSMGILGPILSGLRDAEQLIADFIFP